MKNVFSKMTCLILKTQTGFFSLKKKKKERKNNVQKWMERKWHLDFSNEENNSSDRGRKNELFFCYQKIKTNIMNLTQFFLSKAETKLKT